MESNMIQSLEDVLDCYSRRSCIFTTKSYLYLCTSCGILSTLCFFLAMIASGFFPPMPPYWEADRVYEHYQSHKKGIQAGSVLLLLSGAFYMPYTAALSSQLRRIPNLHPIFLDTQLAGGISCIVSFIFPSMILAWAGFRDYGAQTTLIISDLFWLSCMLPWTTFWMQSWAIAWAVWADRSTKPVLPKTMALVNFITPFGCAAVTGVHTTYYGPFAWNGALGYWVILSFFTLQVTVDSLCLFQGIRNMPLEDEKDTSCA